MDTPKYFEDACRIVAAECIALLISKQKDYGKDNILEFGELGLLIRANDKMARLKNLLKSGTVPRNENVEDTWSDLANYAIIALMVRWDWWKLPLKEEKHGN
jgi:hypothetical protein